MASTTAPVPFSGGPHQERYSIVSQLGAGGYGQVFLAVHRETGQRVAIKQYRKNGRGGISRSVLREISSCLENETNPFIKHVADLGIDEENIWVAFDCQDYHLRDYAGKYGTQLPLRIIKLILLQLLRGLNGLHTSGLIHRDIKPDNIFVSGFDFPVVKIGDLGHARGMLFMDWPRRVYSDAVGTPSYKAPEQYIPRAGYGAGVDIYAVALVICELLLGERIIVGATELDILAQQLSISGLSVEEAIEERVLPSSFAEYSDQFYEAQKLYPTANTLMPAIERVVANKALTYCDCRIVPLLKEMLQFSSDMRPSATEALQSHVFRDLDATCIPR